MKRILMLVSIMLAIVAMLAVPVVAQASPLHQHYLDTPGATSEPGQGLSASCEGTPPAPHEAFENLHEGLHLQGQQGFNQERNPVTLRTQRCPATS